MNPAALRGAVVRLAAMRARPSADAPTGRCPWAATGAAARWRSRSIRALNAGSYRCPPPFAFFLALMYLSPAGLLGLLLTGPFPVELPTPGVPLCLLGLAPPPGLFPLCFAQLLPLPLVVFALRTSLGLFLSLLALLVGHVQLGSCRLAPCHANLPGQSLLLP